MQAYGNSACAPVFIQSFEVGNLQYLNRKTDIQLVQLIDADDVNADGSISLVAPYKQPYDFVVAGDARTFADLLSDEGLDFVKSYADAVGPWKPYLVKTVADQHRPQRRRQNQHQRPPRRRQHRCGGNGARQGPAGSHLDFPQ